MSCLSVYVPRLKRTSYANGMWGTVSGNEWQNLHKSEISSLYMLSSPSFSCLSNYAEMISLFFLFPCNLPALNTSTDLSLSMFIYLIFDYLILICNYLFLPLIYCICVDFLSSSYLTSLSFLHIFSRVLFWSSIFLNNQLLINYIINFI